MFEIDKSELISIALVGAAACTLALVLLIGRHDRSDSMLQADRMESADPYAPAPSKEFMTRNVPRGRGAGSSPAPARAPDTLAKENRLLASENAALKKRLNDVLNWILINFRGKFPLSEQFMGKLRLEPLTEDYFLQPEVVELLKITPAESRQINEALRVSADILREIEAATLTVSNVRPDKVILNVPPFPGHGKLLQEDLYAALEVTLGSARFDRFLQVAEPDMRDNFAYFGEAARTLIFELAYSSDGSDPRLVIKDAWVLPAGENRRTIEVVESTVTNLPAKYQAYLGWLPDYVTAYVPRAY